MEKEIVKIINKALDDTPLTKEELIKMFSVSDLSEEAFAIRKAGRDYSERLLNHKAEIHGQIGIDAGLCPRRCKFCSFSCINNAFPKHIEFSHEEIIRDVQSLEAQGANAIYLMATASYKFEKYIDLAKDVFKHRQTDIPIIANIDDFDSDKATELKKLGFAGVYHAIRIGEGSDTGIPLKKRLASIQAAKDAGLYVGMCVEPIGPEHSLAEIAEKTLYTRDLGAVFSGAMRRTNIPTSPLKKHGQSTYLRMATLVAAVSLATGNKVTGNCTHEPNALGVNAGANLLWAEVGSNPRDNNAETVRGLTVARCKDLYHECGWDVLSGPSKFFM